MLGFKISPTTASIASCPAEVISPLPGIAKLKAVDKSTSPSLAICTAPLIKALAAVFEIPRAVLRVGANKLATPAVIAATAKFIINPPASNESSTLTVLVKLEPFH